MAPGSSSERVSKTGPPAGQKPGLMLLKAGRSILTAVLLLAGIAAGIYLTCLGIVLQRLDESMSRFDDLPTASSYLWWVVSALGLPLIAACIRGAIRTLRRRHRAAEARCVHETCQ